MRQNLPGEIETISSTVIKQFVIYPRNLSLHGCSRPCRRLCEPEVKTVNRDETNWSIFRAVTPPRDTLAFTRFTVNSMRISAFFIQSAEHQIPGSEFRHRNCLKYPRSLRHQAPALRTGHPLGDHHLHLTAKHLPAGQYSVNVLRVHLELMKTRAVHHQSGTAVNSSTLEG